MMFPELTPSMYLYRYRISIGAANRRDGCLTRSDNRNPVLWDHACDLRVILRDIHTRAYFAPVSMF